MNRPQHAVAAGPAAGTAGTSFAAGSTTGSATSSKQPLKLWGKHPVRAALANPRRRIDAGWATPRALAELTASRVHRPEIAWTGVTAAQLAALLPAGAVHQGVAVMAEPLPRIALENVLDAAAPAGPLIVLDRVTDPQNVGAVLRSCAAFGAAALVVADRHAPPESGALAKAAAGALEVVPWVRVVNLARSLAAIRAAGRWTVGLDGSAAATIEEAGLGSSNTALVLGAEGKGLRRLTKEKCDILVRIPMQYANHEKRSNLIDSLNVSNAAAIALYELCRD